LFDIKVSIALTRPEEQFGDYATNVALQLTRQLGKKPCEIAETLAVKLRETLAGQVSEISVAGPGFLNLKLSDEALLATLYVKPAEALAGQSIVVEYSDPNPFKILHAGHLYTSIVGDAIANLLEHAGAHVHRVNFGGDVGLHVAKCLWAILFYGTGGDITKEDQAWQKIQELHPEIPAKDNPDLLTKRVATISNYYVQGNEAYENTETPAARQEIIDLNKRIYQIHEEADHDSVFAKIYWTCRQWSYDYFDNFYKRIGSCFEKYYPESETALVGLQTVREHIGQVYEDSDGAVIFDGEKYGLHTRVFINSEGLPTYETKDVGLIMKKWQDYHFDQSIVITGNDIIEYMKVVLKSIEQFMPELPAKTKHLTHGIVRLEGGAKMSSRRGNILWATDVLDAAAVANKKLTGQDNEQTALGAVKYAFLKNRIGGDVIYDPEESVSLEGNSGPYLQYAHVRARSILRKAGNNELAKPTGPLESGERSLTRKISEYPEVVDKAVDELMPHHICTYLYELAQVFNRFYENNRVIGDERQDLRLALVRHYSETLRNGLQLLGIAAPEQM
jgi:arginyl-tRNA synthetase